jgi:transcriptional regulator with XRE-family HTH domain
VTLSEARSPNGAGRSDRLGAFLRDRRGKVSLEQAGLPGRRGGRAATLTQEDLARLTGYSIRTISGLEQGTDHRPTPDLLEAIAAALRLSTAERHTLWYLATKAPPPEESYLSGLDPGMARLVRLVDPQPAMVYDLFWDIQTYNGAMAAWACDWSKRSPEQRNFARWLLLDPHARHVHVDWEQHLAPAFVGRMRMLAAQMPQHPTLTGLIGEADVGFQHRGLLAPTLDRAPLPPARPHRPAPGRRRDVPRAGDDVRVEPDQARRRAPPHRLPAAGGLPARPCGDLERGLHRLRLTRPHLSSRPKRSGPPTPGAAPTIPTGSR